MLSTLIEFLASLTDPLTFSLWLIPCGILAWVLRRRVVGGVLLAVAIPAGEEHPIVFDRIPLL